MVLIGREPRAGISGARCAFKDADRLWKLATRLSFHMACRGKKSKTARAGNDSRVHSSNTSSERR